MKKITLTILLMIFCCVSQQYAQKTERRTHSKFNKVGREIKTLDEHVYTYLFNSVVNFEREAEIAENDEKKSFLANYFQNESGITNEQYLNLKILSYNFVSAYRMTPNNKKTQLIKTYEYLLQGTFGEEDFDKFKSYLSNRIAPKLKVIKYANFTSIGSSSISFNATTNTLTSNSGIIFSGFLPPVPPVPCSTTATMTGPNVSETGSDSADCNVRTAQVTLTSTVAIPGSHYCVTANHTYDTQTQTTSDCLDTPGVNVTSVTFEQIETDDLPISVNPNEGGGFRIFADDKQPNDPKNRRKIRIKAKYGQAIAGVDIYFNGFDMDDPSIVDSSNTDGYDNKDEVLPLGQFSIPSGATGCQNLSTSSFPKIKCPTNADGESVVEFTLSRQPGDNFAFTASKNNNPDGDILPNGLDITDATDQPIPTICPNVTVCRSEMITVWRRLHLEVDSMGVVSGNKEEGHFTFTKKVSNTDTFVFITPDNQLEDLRFSDGRLVAGKKQFKVVLSGTDFVVLRPQYGGASTVLQGERFILYDDDDYNKTIGSELIGDNGENITNPSYMMEGLSATSDLPNDNILATAYIKPVYDAQDSTDDNTFHLNLENRQQTTIRAFFDKWDSSATNTDRKYWSAYILGAYQPDESRDGDGIGVSTYALVDSITGYTDDGRDGEGSGALIFLEMNRKKELSTFSTDKINPNSLQVAVAHEVGHLLGCKHGELGIMGNSDGVEISSNKFSATSLNVIRKIKHP